MRRISMKKSIFNIVLLSMLFVLGACSNGGNTDDAIVDAAIKDALAQIGSIEGKDTQLLKHLNQVLRLKLYVFCISLQMHTKI